MKIASGSASAIAWGYTTAGSSTAVTKGIIGVEAALPPQYESGAKWLANKGTYSTARGMVDVNGRPLWNITEAWPTMSNGMSPSLLGYPILKSQFMPDIAGDAYAMLFGDFKGYQIVDRVGLSIEVFREVLGLQDLVVVYARKRVGGQLMRPWMVKALKCAAS
jgi:HK97 family phage major capsid protein